MRLKSNFPATGSDHERPLRIIAASVLLTGVITVTSVLFSEIRRRGGVPIVSADAHITLLVGLTFIYLATLLRRGKRSAWLIAIPIYVYIVLRNFQHYILDLPHNHMHPLPAVLNLMVPIASLTGLAFYYHLFSVKSEVRNSTLALRRAVLVLLVAFLYGVIGFQLLDKHDFHQEISVFTGAHYVVDQFGLTTDKQLVPYTRRARLFLDSLAYVSAGSLFYVVVSFFSPIRFRLMNQEYDYETIERLLKDYPANSEDFFKLWPHDKAYFFNDDFSAGLAYRVVGGVALCVSDPAGQTDHFADLIRKFNDYCRTNDWEPALIHTQTTHSKLYRSLDFEMQKIGEEAVVDVNHFMENVLSNKYFRQIVNKFERQKYSVEFLKPPHSAAILRRLKEISDDWLQVPGRAERGFMMGYFSDTYMQQCDIMVVRDEAATMQAFINLLPLFDPEEANFDMLRHTRGSAGNINDFLLINVLKHLHQQGIKRLNLGLCPLAGLRDQEPDNDSKNAVDSVLRFVYANGNRFYSFQGLQRFKAKYEPHWRSRYIAYKGGLGGFTRTLNALLRAMRVRHLHSK